MAPGSIENCRGRRQGPKNWLVPAAVVVIALLTAFVVERLYESTDGNHRVQILLIQIEEEAKQQLGEYEAIDEGEATPEISGQIAESRADLQRSLNPPEAQVPGEQPARIRELPVTGKAAIDEDLRLIKEAEAIDEMVDPTFEEPRDVLESADTGFGDYADRVDMVADVGGFAVAGLSVLLTAWFVRRDRNRRSCATARSATGPPTRTTLPCTSRWTPRGRSSRSTASAIKAKSTAGRGAAFVVTLPVEHRGVGESTAQGDEVDDYAAISR